MLMIKEKLKYVKTHKYKQILKTLTMI